MTYIHGQILTGRPMPTKAPSMSTTNPPIFHYTDGSALYRLTARAFISRFPVWEANRTMDEAHVGDLESSIKSPKEIQGPFSVITYMDEEGKSVNRVIDGQHRQEVLRRYFEKTVDAADFDVLVRRYLIKDHDAAVAIFQTINHAKPMVYKGSEIERVHETVAALRKNFVGFKPDGTSVALIRPSTCRPFLSTETLETALKSYDLAGIDASKVVAHAETMNAFYAADPSRIPSMKVTKNIMERAMEYGFFLGLDPKCSWLVSLRSAT